MMRLTNLVRRRASDVAGASFVFLVEIAIVVGFGVFALALAWVLVSVL